MGWHYILKVTCKILPEFQEFVKKKYLWLFSDVNDGYKETKDYNYDRYMQSMNGEFNDDDIKSQSSEESESRYEKEERLQRETVYGQLTKPYKDLVDIWNTLEIGHHFQDYTLEGGIWKIRICKKVIWHNGDLREDYESFLRDILVPITSEISYCEIESDDFGDVRYYYTDSELRNISFNLRDQIKIVEHTYNEDHTEILESRIVYKRSIKTLQFLDLERAYKRGY